MSIEADPRAGVSTAGEIMLFGVRVVVDCMRKSVSLNNLSQYQHPIEPAGEKSDPTDGAVVADYASADEAAHHNSAAAARGARKRGVPWTEEEHKLFLVGLQKVGKGDWRGISKNYVKTRTPTQVASHAQKYFLRRTNLNRRRRRSSLFDITTDTVEDHHATGNQDKMQQPASPTPEMSNGTQTLSMQKPMEHLCLQTPTNAVCHQAYMGLSQTGLNLNLAPMNCDSPQPLSLNLLLSYDHHSYGIQNTRNSTGHQTFTTGDSFITVA